MVNHNADNEINFMNIGLLDPLRDKKIERPHLINKCHSTDFDVRITKGDKIRKIPFFSNYFPN